MRATERDPASYEKVEPISAHAFARQLEAFVENEYPGTLIFELDGFPSGYVHASADCFAKLVQLVIFNIRGRALAGCKISFEDNRMVIKLTGPTSAGFINRITTVARLAGFSRDLSHRNDDELVLYTLVYESKEFKLYAEALERLKFYLYLYLN